MVTREGFITERDITSIVGNMGCRFTSRAMVHYLFVENFIDVGDAASWALSNEDMQFLKYLIEDCNADWVVRIYIGYAIDARDQPLIQSRCFRLFINPLFRDGLEYLVNQGHVYTWNALFLEVCQIGRIESAIFCLGKSATSDYGDIIADAKVLCDTSFDGTDKERTAMLEWLSRDNR